MMKRILRWLIVSLIFWTVIAVIFALPQLGLNGHPQKVLVSALAQWWSWGLLVPGILALDHVLPFSAQRIVLRVISHLFLGPLVAVAYSYVEAVLKALLGVGAW